MEAYSLNPQILPGQPLTKKEHHRALVWLVIALAILTVGGIFFWLNKSSKPAAPVNSEEQLRSQVAAVLRQASVEPTDQDVNEIASMLSKSKAQSPSSEDRASVTALLKGNQ